MSRLRSRHFPRTVSRVHSRQLGFVFKSRALKFRARFCLEARAPPQGPTETYFLYVAGRARGGKPRIEAKARPKSMIVVALAALVGLAVLLDLTVYFGHVERLDLTHQV